MPSVEELSNLVDLSNANKVYNFLKGTNKTLHHIWLRDNNGCAYYNAMDLGYSIGSMNNDEVTNSGIGVRSAFVINLSKIDYTVTGSVNYK